MDRAEEDGRAVEAASPGEARANEEAACPAGGTTRHARGRAGISTVNFTGEGQLPDQEGPRNQRSSRAKGKENQPLTSSRCTRLQSRNTTLFGLHAQLTCRARSGPTREGTLLPSFLQRLLYKNVDQEQKRQTKRTIHGMALTLTTPWGRDGDLRQEGECSDTARLRDNRFGDRLGIGTVRWTMPLPSLWHREDRVDHPRT